MYCTLYQFLRLSPADQARVTHLDLSIASEEDLYRARSISACDVAAVSNQLGPECDPLDESEEYYGQRRDTYPRSR